MPRQCIIITRPESDAAITAELLKEIGFSYFIEPVMDIITMRHDDFIGQLRKYDAAVVTSKNALRAFKQYGGCEGFCIILIGESTYKFALENSFHNVIYAGDNVKELQLYIKKNYSGKNLLYASGQVITKELTIGNCGANIMRLAVYRTLPVTVLSASFIQGLESGKFSAIMFFSSKTAEIFNNLMISSGLEEYKKQLTAIVLSENIANKMRHYGFGATIYTKSSKKDALIKLLQKFLI